MIFDLDETLIHVKRDNEDENFDHDKMDEDFEPDEYIMINDPKTGEVIEAGFSIRPLATECLEFANKYFEVAIFTAGH